MPVKLRYFIILIPLLFIMPVHQIYSGGSREDQLEIAEQLIDEKRYNEAIILITEVIRTNPKRLDQGERLLKQIRDARSDYNQLYDELIVMLEQEDIDEDAAYALVQQLRALDKNPNKASMKAMADATAGIVFKVNDRQFRTIMAEADVLIADGKYWDAVELYLTGFNLHREQFEIDEYGDLVEARIYAIIDDIREQAEVFLNRESELTTRFGTSIPAALEEGVGTFYQEVQAGSEDLLSLVPVRKEVEELAALLEEQRIILVEGQEQDDIPYLSTLRILTKGRDEALTFQGISGAIDAMFDYGVSVMETNSGDALNTALDEGIAALDQNQLEDAGSSFTDAYTLALAAVHSRSLRLTRQQSESGLVGSEENLAAQAAAATPVLDGQAAGKIAKGFLDLIPYYEELNQLIRNFEGTNIVEEQIIIRNDLVQRVDDVLALVDEWDGISSYYSDLNEKGLVLGETLNDIEQLTSVLHNYENVVKDREAELVHIINDNVFNPLQEQADAQTVVLDESKRLLTGTTNGEEGEELLVKKYPREAAELLRPVSQVLTTIGVRVADRLERLEDEKPYITTNPIILQDVQDAQSFLSRLENLDNEIRRLLQEAEEEVRLAQLYRREGEVKIEETESLLQQDEFKEALSALDEAGVAFADSLRHQEDEEFRAQVDAQKQALVEQITQEWQNSVVRQVRSFLNEASTLYQQEEFGQAQVVLLKAEDVWNDANAEQNEEINSWLIRVENALKATTGRVIRETNPLYTEMSNLLNLAQKDFQQGRALINRGDRAQAEQFFQAAEEKIAYVKDTFPINQAAGILRLRIEQLRNPENFESLFESRFEEAVSMGGTEDEAIGYSLLKDLQAINPNYPGITSAIFNAEIRLGIRERPPDQRKIAEANRLYEEARAILAKQRVSDIDLEVALDKLNEAYENNPNDARITRLKDRTQLLRGGSATILTTQDQQQFRLAEQLFLDRKYFEALAVVERLLSDPNNQRYAPLNDLKRRIDSFI